jgi:hypothetical protein
MSQQDTAHAWWSRLRHQGLLLSPVVMLERFPASPERAPFHSTARLRDGYTSFVSTAEARQGESEIEQSAILAWTDALLENYVGHHKTRIANQHSISENLTAAVRIGNKSDTIQPHRVVFADDERKTPALLVMADTSHIVGRGRGRTAYSRFLELLRGTGHRLGLLTNGRQFRLVYAGLDFESWCEWESERWFDDGEGTEELNGLRHLFFPHEVKDENNKVKTVGLPGLLDAVEESRKRQADLSSVLRENVRQAVELLLDEVSSTNRTDKNLFASLVAASSERPLTDGEAHEALLQATVRVVMRLVVCLFAESRQLLPVDFPIYAQAYGVRSLYELLEEATRNEGGTHGLLNRKMAWPRLMALFRLIYGGSTHGAFPMRAYGGLLFRPGDEKSSDAVARALHILEHRVGVCDATIHAVLRKLLRGLLPVIKGKSKTFVEGPVDYTDLRTEFIGLIYEGLLDYRLKRTDEKIGPQVFLNLGREPVLPLSRLEDMLIQDKKGLKDLLTTLRKESVSTRADAEQEETEEKESGEPDDAEEAAPMEAPVVEAEPSGQKEGRRAADYLDAVESAKCWAKEAVKLAGLVRRQGKKESDSQYQQEVEAEATKLINRVVATGEFYLVRAGNTRKGTGTFYTRPQLAVPTVHRTLEPLCYDKAKDGTLVPKEPEVILALKVCDSACGSASFLVAALHYMTDALYKSLCHHRKLDDPEQAKKLTLPYGRLRTAKNDEELVPFPPNDPQWADTFADRIKSLLRRHVVERCIYGVDINPLAVEFARVSLWVETLDPELPFSFLDHKIKVGNSLVGCWLDRVLDYPLKAWEREGGDGKDGPRTQNIESFFKGDKIGNRRLGDGRVKREMRQVIESQFQGIKTFFDDQQTTPEIVVAKERIDYEQLHNISISDPDEREEYYREHVERSEPVRRLKQAMDEWCSLWFWPMTASSANHVPLPLSLHAASTDRNRIVHQLINEWRFFHWEIEFPDVFSTTRCGFDAVIGNPPWDNPQPNPQEFFSDHDPLFRTYSRIESLRVMDSLFAEQEYLREKWITYCGNFKAFANWVANSSEPFGDSSQPGNYLGHGSKGLMSAWSDSRKTRTGFASNNHPFRLQEGRVFTYRLFMECYWYLLSTNSRIGIIVPSNFYSDLGSKALRETFFFKGCVESLYAFQNEKKVFAAAHHSQKQVVIIATKGRSTKSFRAKFRLGVGDSPEAWQITQDLLANNEAYLTWTPGEIQLLSPKSFTLPEFRTQRDLAIYRKIYSRSVRIGDNASGWKMKFAIDFMMNTDAKHFPRLELWEEKGFQQDDYCQWVSPSGCIALPLYQGGMIHHFDSFYQNWSNGLWMTVQQDAKVTRPRFLMSLDDFSRLSRFNHMPKVIFRRIARCTDNRTFICSFGWQAPCGDSLFLLAPTSSVLENTLLLLSCFSSLTFDFVVRERLAGTNVSWFVVQECPLPNISPNQQEVANTVSRSRQMASRLILVHRRFAPEWLTLKYLFPELSAKEWKHWWAVTEADRLRLRVEIDALCADLYGLEPDDFDWIVRDDPTNPKGFYRVDRKLPFRERLTGLAAAAFRALKEAKWSAETAAMLSNDKFFEIIGIPEMTTGPDPLIRNRDGCHRWKPEEFGKDDPRHGWTWEDCWKDAVALLGSEDAVRKYIEGHSKADEEGEDKTVSEHTFPKDLFGNPIPTDLFGKELQEKSRKKK